MGYLWTPLIRINGVVKNLKTSFTYAGGPTKIDLNYVPVYERRETVTKKVNILHHGFRVNVTLTFAIGGSMADNTQLSEIVNALKDPTKTVELSLNNGSTYRVIELRRYEGPDPFDGKTFAGAFFRLEVETQDLISDVPAIGSGSTW